MKRFLIGLALCLFAGAAQAQPPNLETDVEYKDPWLKHAIEVIENTYGDLVSVSNKDKDLLKFGTHTAIGTGWETLAEMQDSETEETFVAGNTITTVVSSSTSDDSSDSIIYEYHTLANGVATFGVSSAVTLNGQTAVTLPTGAYRVNRAYNAGTGALVGNIAFYEGGATTSGKPDTDSTVHALIVAGEQQTQKAATTISNNDYWIISGVSVSVTEKTAAWAECRLETKPIARSYWRPITENFSAKDASGAVQIDYRPYAVVPKNYDVRIACRANTAGVSMAGGFNGMLASVVQ